VGPYVGEDFLPHLRCYLDFVIVKRNIVQILKDEGIAEMVGREYPSDEESQPFKPLAEPLSKGILKT